MKVRKLVVAVSAGALCAAVAVGVLAAEQGRGPRKWNPGQGRGQGKFRAACSEAIQAELERHKAAMQELKEDAKALREKVADAVHEARTGKDKADPEGIKKLIEGYDGDATEIATAIVDERIAHHEKVLSILQAEHDSIVECMKKGLLSPGMGRKGRGRGQWRGPEGGPSRGPQGGPQDTQDEESGPNT